MVVVVVVAAVVIPVVAMGAPDSAAPALPANEVAAVAPPLGQLALAGFLTAGEGRKVSDKALINYRRCADRYELWRASGGRVHSLATVEVNVVDYLDYLGLVGAALGEMETSAAAILHFTPGACRTHLKRIGRALAGWKKGKPPRSRLPLAEELVASLSVVLLHLGSRESCLKTILSKHAYLRPGEVEKLRVEDLNAPAGGPQQGVQLWTITVAPSHRLETDKVGVSDEAVVLDQLPWLGPELAKLKVGKLPSDLLFAEPVHLAVKNWKAACSALRIEAHRYQLRHAGASADTLARTRSTGEIMARGRWSSAASLRRYAKPGVLQRCLHRLPAELRTFGAWSVQNLQQVVCEGVPVVLPELQHLPVVSVVQ